MNSQCSQSVCEQPVQPVGEESLQPGGEQPVIVMDKTDFG